MLNQVASKERGWDITAREHHHVGCKIAWEILDLQINHVEVED